jgi:membrane-bound lytic murein transglycosylase D
MSATAPVTAPIPSEGAARAAGSGRDESTVPHDSDSATELSPDAAAEEANELPDPPPAWDIEVEAYEQHARVEHFVQRFSGPVRESFEVALARQSRFAPMIHAKLRAGGLPEDMIFLPLIESWYDPHAYSVAAAVGMWQFMSSTARGVGLRVDWWVDERRDPVASTDAAVRYLNELRETLGSLYLAAAAYNGGPGRVSRGLEAHATTLDGLEGDALFFALSDQTRALRPETRDYVPKLIAAALVGKNPRRYGVTARTLEPFTYDSVHVPAATPLAAIAKATKVELDTLLDYNPQILRGMTPPTGPNLWLRVPVGHESGFAEALAALPAAERAGVRTVVTRDGDFITRIAQANRLTAKQLNWYNPTATRLKNGNLHAGQRILVPRLDVARAARDVPNPSIERYGVGSTYTVKRGDNLSLIARRHGVTIAQLRRLNRLDGDFLRIGQRLRIR